MHAAEYYPESLQQILSLLLEAPFNILVKNISDLNFILPFIAKANIEFARFRMVFLSENIQQNTESFKFASSNPSEFLRCYFRLQEIIENQTNPAAQWLQDIITGKCEFDKISFQSYRSSLDKSPLSEIFHKPSLESLFSRLNQTTFKEQLTTFREENIENDANVDATVPRKS